MARAQRIQSGLSQAAVPQRPLPEPDHVVPERRQGSIVGRHGVVGKEPAHHLPQPVALFLDRSWCAGFAATPPGPPAAALASGRTASSAAAEIYRAASDQRGALAVG
jgi:hypothetical protein